MIGSTSQIHPEVLLGGAYAIMLVATAYGLEWLARRAHRRSEAYELGGFTYHRDLDFWVCPTGHQLVPTVIDHLRQRVHYRARPTACNRCPLKRQCTSSETGREIIQSRADWPHSEVARFHRGLSLLLMLLATVVIAVAGARHATEVELATLSGPLILVLLTARRLWPALRARPADLE